MNDLFFFSAGAASMAAAYGVLGLIESGYNKWWRR